MRAVIVSSRTLKNGSRPLPRCKHSIGARVIGTGSSLTERWRPVPNFPLYRVSNFARVRNLLTGKVLQAHLVRGVYASFGLRHGSRAYKRLTHRLAAEALLDLVISSDTAPVHLAGALGRPVWVLLRYVPDWRWLLDRDDSSWYPSARLFRQPVAGDWESVVGKVIEELSLMRPRQRH